jgi:hypothetical protein
MNIAPDPELESVFAAIKTLDPDGKRTANVLRGTFDQLYDGQRTGRYKWDQLYKTEKTHCGTLVEINLQREFDFQDGSLLDYTISGTDVDCKYSQELHGWMIPPEAHGKLCLLLWANDAESKWNMGIVRALPEYQGAANRDRKTRLNAAGRSAIRWLFQDEPLPPNILLQLEPSIVARIMSQTSGQKKLNDLFRNALGLRVGRGVVATVAQQDDYMKRIRGNGGSRSALKSEGIVILGQYKPHREIAVALGSASPEKGESIALRLVPAKPRDPKAAMIGGRKWRIARDQDPIVAAPNLPNPSID